MATMSFKRPRRKGFTRDDFILACLRRQSGKTNHRAEAGSSVDDRGGIVGERGPVLVGKKMPDYFLPAGGLGVACGAASALATAASDFSAKFMFVAKSSKSPSREMPSPYIMSNSASRKGAAVLFLTIFTRVREPMTWSPSLMAPMRRISMRTDE